MESVTSTEAAKNFGGITDRAKRAPIQITSHRRPQIVMLPVEEYERLRRLDRRVIATAALPQDLRDAIAGSEAPPPAARFNHEAEG